MQGDSEDYRNPLNSMLPAVLARGAGLPITLALLHCVVGRLAGIPLTVINFPGHVRLTPPLKLVPNPSAEVGVTGTQHSLFSVGAMPYSRSLGRFRLMARLVVLLKGMVGKEFMALPCCVAMMSNPHPSSPCCSPGGERP